MDILSKLGSKKSAEGSGNTEPHQKSTASANVTATPKDNDLLEKAKNINSTSGEDDSVSAATDKGHSAGQVESNEYSSKEEPSGNVKDPDSWSKESAFKEIKKLREENKAVRLKYEESLEKLKSDTEARLSQKLQELDEYKKAKQELDQLKEKETDKKRSLEEKLADRENKLASMQASLETTQRAYENKMQELQEKAEKYEAEMAAQEQIYKNRLKAELEKIPEKFRTYAEVLTKGAGDSREALVLISEAKLQGLFEDKTVVVNHSVPGANEGARTTKERMDEINKEARSKLSGVQKIGEALKQIRSGSPNSAFRGRN